MPYNITVLLWISYMLWGMITKQGHMEYLVNHEKIITI